MPAGFNPRQARHPDGRWKRGPGAFARAEHRVKVAGAHALGRALIGTGKGLGKAVSKGQRATGINPRAMEVSKGLGGEARRGNMRLTGTRRSRKMPGT